MASNLNRIIFCACSPKEMNKHSKKSNVCFDLEENTINKSKNSF